MKRITILASAALFAISLSFAPATVTANTTESIVFTGPEGEKEKDKDKKDKKDKKADSKKGKTSSTDEAPKKCDKSSAGAEGKSGCCSKSAEKK